MNTRTRKQHRRMLSRYCSPEPPKQRPTGRSGGAGAILPSLSDCSRRTESSLRACIFGLIGGNYLWRGFWPTRLTRLLSPTVATFSNSCSALQAVVYKIGPARPKLYTTRDYKGLTPSKSLARDESYTLQKNSHVCSLAIAQTSQCCFWPQHRAGCSLERHPCRSVAGEGKAGAEAPGLSRRYHRKRDRNCSSALLVLGTRRGMSRSAEKPHLGRGSAADRAGRRKACPAAEQGSVRQMRSRSRSLVWRELGD